MDRGLERVIARPVRSDAVRNRGAILKAAAAMFAAHGERVDVREIARCAGVGMGTLYRHFPTKDDLLETVLHEHFAEWTHTARHAAATQTDAARHYPDFSAMPWSARPSTAPWSNGSPRPGRPPQESPRADAN